MERFAEDAAAPVLYLGAEEQKGTWEITRVTPSWINARVPLKGGDSLVLTLSVPPTKADAISEMGADCEGSPGEMEPRYTLARP